MGRLLALSLLLVACPGYLDEGWHVADDGVTLHPGVLPATVDADEDCDAVVAEAVAWWADSLDAPAFILCDGDCDVTVALGLVPWTDTDEAEPMGLAEIEYASDGAVLRCEITISSDIAYDHATALQVARHELGHCLGLADDPGPPATVDLRSVMSSPLAPLGVLTEHDRALLAPYLVGL